MSVHLVACGADLGPTTIAPSTIPTPRLTVSTPVPASTSSISPVPSLTAEVSTPTPNPPALIWSLAWSADGNTIAAATGAGIVLYAVPSLARITTLGQGTYAESVRFSPDGARLACTCGPGDVELWDWQHARLVETIVDEDKSFTSLAFSPDGQHLASGDYNGRVQIWEVTNGNKLQISIPGPNAEVASLAFDLAGKRILAAYLNGRVNVWDAQSGQLVHEFSEGLGIFVVAFSPDGKLMATSDIGGMSLKLWELETGDVLSTITGITVVRFTFSADSQRVVCLCHEGILQWEATSGKPLRTITPYDPQFYSLAVSPDGKQVAIGTRSGDIQLLNMGSK